MWVVEAKAGATAPVVDSYVLTMLQGLDSPGWVRTTILKIFSLTHFHEVTTRLWRPCQPPTLTSTEANCSRKRQAPRQDFTGNDFSCLFLTSQFYFFRFRQGRRVWFDRRSRKHHLEAGLPYDVQAKAEREWVKATPRPRGAINILSNPPNLRDSIESCSLRF